MNREHDYGPPAERHADPEVQWLADRPRMAYALAAPASVGVRARRRLELRGWLADGSRTALGDTVLAAFLVRAT